MAIELLVKHLNEWIEEFEERAKGKRMFPDVVKPVYISDLIGPDQDLEHADLIDRVVE